MKDGRPFNLLRLSRKLERSESGEWLRTCTIITGEPNDLIAQIHPRMPVILPERHHAAWLEETENGNLKELLVPLPCRPDANVGNLSAGKQSGRMMIHHSGKPVPAEPTR